MSRQPRLIPVLDVMGGEVVHAVGGRREGYLPVRSRLTDATAVPDVAAALLAAAGANELYIADLDGIRYGMADETVWRYLTEVRHPIYLDNGGLYHSTPPHVRHVLGSEMGFDPPTVREWVREAGPVTFSIDLFDGKLPKGWEVWGLAGPTGVLGLARRVYELGVRSLIVLDLGRVGTGRGSGTEPVCRAIREELPGVELIAGGGIRNWDDIRRLEDAGVDAVLVASALHDGTLGTTSSPSAL